MTDRSATPQQPQSPPDSSSLTPDALRRLHQQADEYLKGWQRAKADYANLRKQTAKERAELVQLANAALLEDLLPLYDNLKRAISHVPDEAKQQEWGKGILLIQTQFQALFTVLGLEEVLSVGQPFDPTLHEAVAKEHRQGVPAGRILRELSTGFRLHGRVLVPAKVTVSE